MKWPEEFSKSHVKSDFNTNAEYNDLCLQRLDGFEPKIWLYEE